MKLVNTLNTAVGVNGEDSRELRKKEKDKFRAASGCEFISTRGWPERGPERALAECG